MNVLKRLQTNDQREFTLIEMIVVIAIIGVLAAIAAPMVTDYLGTSKERAYESDVAQVKLAVEAYYGDPSNGRFLGQRQYPEVGQNQTNQGTLEVRTVSFDHVDDGLPLTNAAATWTDDGDGVREIEAASGDTWTAMVVDRAGSIYYADARYYFLDMDELVRLDC